MAEKLVTITPKKVYPYDPTRLAVFWAGERLHGFAADEKVFINRGLDGKAEVLVTLQGTSYWIKPLKEYLGGREKLEVSYLSEEGPYPEALGFVSEMTLTGYYAKFGALIPEFTFIFKAEEE